jgi:PAS domain S-box-containing protein
MQNSELWLSILESLETPVVFVDTNHQIQYVNPSGRKQYARYGEIQGKSIFECHTDKSRQKIEKIFAQLQAGAEEVLYSDKPPKKYYMRAVRDGNRRLLGYYERLVVATNSAKIDS